MKHLGDISKIHGAKIEPVDIISFGSPCQDLSVAGKRAGLKHTENGDGETTRSGLFMEAVRIIKEMREATDGKYPRFALWENVPGAFSSNKGEDFRIVLEELIQIVEEEAVMPEVPKTGWAYADTYIGDGWSLAYRVFDAQHWGVPQRRRRIYLVADFAGECAGKILFERQGLRGHLTESPAPRERVTAYVEVGTGADDREGATSIAFAQNQRDEVRDLKDKAGAIQAQPGMKQQTFIVDSIGGQSERGWEGDIAPTLKASHYKFAPCVSVEAAGFKAGQSKTGGIGWQEECAATLSAQASGTEPTVCVYESHPMDSRVKELEDDISPTVSVKWHKGAADTPLVVEPKCFDARGNGEGAIVPTLTGDHENRVTDYTAVLCMATQQGGAEIMEDTCPTVTAAAGMSGNNQPVACYAEPIPIHDQATRFSGKRGDKADGKGNGLGIGNEGDPMNTLTSGDRHAVAMTVHGEVQSGTLMSRDYKGVGRWDSLNKVVCQPIAIDRAFFNQGQNALYEPQYYTDGTVPTLVAKGPSAVAARYIVRRLTPTECARLQGFPDEWGHIPRKDELTEEEYSFWHEVRNTHAAINGKAVKDYTKKQMLSWYNKLHTDSAEYKMWGNGIALPNAQYVMQGIEAALDKQGQQETRILK